MVRVAAALSIVAVLSGCCTATVQPTPYQPLGKEGGYEDKQVAPGVYRVRVYGNGSTSGERVQKYAELRGADLCANAGFPRMRLTDGGVSVNQELYGDAYGVETISRPVATYTVVCMSEDEFQRYQTAMRAKLLGVEPSSTTQPVAR